MGFTLSSLKISTGLAAAAREVAGRIFSKAAPLGNAGARTGEATPSRRPLSLCLHVPVLDHAPETLACDAIVARHAQMAREERWEDLLAALVRADQTRAAAPGGARLAMLISRGARADLRAAIARADWDSAATEVARLSALAHLHADSYAAALILAEAHLDLGWARRTAAVDAVTGRADWQEFLVHTQAADRMLDPFDPIELGSAQLAACRYRLVGGLDDGEALFRDWYEDWSDLDPTSADPHAAQAEHLLPNWFGTLAGFDPSARAAARRTRDLSGAAAYAAFYMAAADGLGQAPPGMDLALYLRGLSDFQRVTGCQYRANIVAAAMAELAHGLMQDTLPSTSRVKIVIAALRAHLSGAVREFHIPAWEHGLACIHWAVEQAFADDLAKGADIVLGPDGLMPRMN